MDNELRLLAVHAHPDDESSKGAATMAAYRTRGVRVMVATCTGGERGSVLNPAMDTPEVHADIAAVRGGEMAEAARILDIEHRWLGFVDSGLPEGDPLPPLPDGCFALVDLEQAAAPLVELVRSFRPHVILTYDENGGYPHPDHIRTHEVSMVAFDAAGDADRFPEAGAPWTPLKLYYHQTFQPGRIKALHEAMEARGIDSPYAEWIAERGDRPDTTDRVTTRIPCSDFFEIRDHALRAHATQVDPDGWFFKCPLDLQAEVWPTEDFELARSRVTSDLPESDLFAGIDEAG